MHQEVVKVSDSVEFSQAAVLSTLLWMSGYAHRDLSGKIKQANYEMLG